ncbi:hypothetical protein INE91_03134 [Phocaeicola vulgatus]|nr:hypothetical protein [Phocaeicola vulgatus]
MDIKEYSKLIKAKRKELDGLMKRKMPVIAGRMAKTISRTTSAGRFRKRRITPVAESEKAVLGTDRCGRELRDAALRKEPSLQLRQIHAGRIPSEGGKRTRLCAGQ